MKRSARIFALALALASLGGYAAAYQEQNGIPTHTHANVTQGGALATSALTAAGGSVLKSTETHSGGLSLTGSTTFYGNVSGVAISSRIANIATWTPAAAWSCMTGSTLTLRTNGASAVEATFSGTWLVGSTCYATFMMDGALVSPDFVAAQTNAWAGDRAFSLKMGWLTGTLTAADHSFCVAIYCTGGSPSVFGGPSYGNIFYIKELR